MIQSPRPTYGNARYQDLARWLRSESAKGGEGKGQPPGILPDAHSARRTLSNGQQVGAILLLLFVVTLLLCWFTPTLIVAIGIITIYYLVNLVILFWLAVWRSEEDTTLSVDDATIMALKGEPWPSYTLLVPLYRETEVLDQLLRALKQIEYPEASLEILLLVEDDDHEMRAALRLSALSPSMSVVVVPAGSPRTKPRACTHGLSVARGQFVVIYDAEDIPHPLQLKQAVLAFAQSGNPRLACVQAQLNFYNSRQNLLTRFFTLEYALWFGLVLPGLSRMQCALPLGGTSNHFRASILKTLCGWDAYNVTEDADLGLRLARYGFTTAVLDSTTYEEANARIGNWTRQRTRWIKGYLQTALVALRHPSRLFSLTGLRTTGIPFLVVGGSSLFFLVNPVMWALLGVYLLFRSQVEPVYHLLFPRVTLYTGVFSLIFGNLFFVVIAMVAAYQRRQYRLVPYALLLPLYWVLMSVAAVRAFFQLVSRPHYWEKTQHGLHLSTSRHGVAIAVDETLTIGLERGTRPVVGLTSSMKAERLTERVRAISTLPLPLVNQERRRRSKKERDPFLLAILLLALILSSGATYFSFTQHFILIYGDGISHLLIARRVFDSATPGIGQLGGVWLPLPHLLLSLVIWNDYLWKTGLAGSIVGGGCYLGTVTYIYLAIVRLTKKRYAGFLGSLVFLLNPNVLYLQSSPMTEPVCWVTFTAACYYLLAWIQEDRIQFLLLTAIATFLATLARYDGWILVVLIPLALVLVGHMRSHTFPRIVGDITVFLLPGSIGILLWFLWSKAIFNNTFYFQSGPYSSQQQTLGVVNASELAVRGHLLRDVWLYSLDTIETLGSVLFLLAVFALLLFLLRGQRWKSPEVLGCLLFLSPFAFYSAALFGGQVALLDNHTALYLSGMIPKSESPYLFNARYGSEMVAPAAIFIGTLFAQLGAWKQEHRLIGRGTLGQGLLLLVIIVQSGWVTHGGVISVIGNSNPPFCVGSYKVEVYLQEHYTGGSLLMTEYPFHLSVASADIPFRRVIWEGSQDLWERALAHPLTMTWVVDAPGDIVATSLAKSDPQFFQQFALVAISDTGLRLYHHNGLPLLLARPLSDYLRGEQQFCALSTYTSRH